MRTDGFLGSGRNGQREVERFWFDGFSTIAFNAGPISIEPRKMITIIPEDSEQLGVIWAIQVAGQSAIAQTIQASHRSSIRRSTLDNKTLHFAFQ
ncbi:hypothetical protein AMR42_14460 [Limnothrix sp. PR1529]|nr:hypothetical protein BCR12_05730 [Limnothrix sp. P13C2]PIB07322.1 hypothetical protein AMR42_14460 [Limnothrix sp. PR1529]